MAESSAPPLKSKPGSLRDRIAAFEKPAAPASNPKPPPVRPKPGHVAWKAAPPSPTENNEAEEKNKIIGGGMSASDAKESIRTGGGSLKERMAALQGMGAFGGGSPSPPPPPGPKPVKRPPLVVPPPPEDGEEMGKELQVDEEAEQPPEPERVDAVSLESPEATNNDDAADGGDAEERQRREAIAARMARLGGARVGMAPPMLGPKPVVKPKSEAPYREKSSQKGVSGTASKPASAKAVSTLTDNSADVGDASLPVTFPSNVTNADSSESRQKGSHDDALFEKHQEYKVPSSPIAIVVPRPDTSSPLPSNAPQVASTSSHSPPSSVPIPSAPRRAAPPRKKRVGPKQQGEFPPETISPTPGEPPEVALAAPVDVIEDKKEDHEIATTILADGLEEKAVREDKAPSPDNSETVALGEIIHEAATDNVDTVQDPSKGVDATSRSVGPDENDIILEERAPLAYEPEPEASTVKAEGIDAVIYGAEARNLEEEVKVLDAVDEQDNDAIVRDVMTTAVEKDPIDKSSTAPEEGTHSPVEVKSIDTEEEADDDQDQDRKTRLAEKIAKMGGLNPFSAFSPRPNLPSRIASQDDEHGKVVESSFATDDTAEKEDSAQEIDEEDAIASPASPSRPLESIHNVEDYEPSINSSKQDNESEDAVSATQNEAEGYEDEATRKRLIAERIAKMGGRNPFSAVPAFSERQSTLQHTSPQDSETCSNNEDGSHLYIQEEKDETLDGEDAPNSAEVVDHEDEVEETRVSSEAEVELIQLPSEGSVKDPETEDLAFHSGPSSAEKLSVGPDTALLEQREILPEEEEAEKMAPSRILRPIPPVPLAKLSDTDASERSRIRSPVERAASPRRSLPPPPVEEVVATQHVDEPEEMSPDETTTTNDVHDAPPPPPPRLTHKRESTNLSTSSTDLSSVPSPPSRRSVPPRPASDEKPPSASQEPPVPRQIASPPGRPPIPQMRPMSQQPTPPSRRSIPPPPRPQVADVRTHSPTRTLPQPSEDKFPSPVDTPSHFTDPSFPPRVITRLSFEEDEILPDSEPDPVDPSLPSPRSPLMRGPMFPPSHELSEDPQEDDGQTRRRTIAERMAKLGGIKFGAPPPLKRPVQPVHAASQDENTDFGSIIPETQETPQEDEQTEEEQSEEVERARRQTIAARLAGMGGMRFGMLPQTASSHPRVASDSSAKGEEPLQPPPQRPLPVVDHEDSKEFGSDDGVKVEGTESEMSMEEVHTEDAEEEVEEIPPPPPPREHPSPPLGVPPPPPRSERSSIPTSVPEGRQPTPQVLSSNNDFVMVEDQAAPSPPPPPPRTRPSYRLPPVLPPKDVETPPWELPNIPSGSFSLSVGANFAMDSSITSEDSTAYPPPASSSPEPVRETPPHVAVPSAQAQVPPNSEELLGLANSIGKLVYKTAASLFDKSKKVIVGDGTSQGFVSAVLAQVPQASRSSFGYLVYAQTGNNVTRRLSNIMPGDIVELIDAKLKGHKGLQSYHQSAGTTEEPLVAVIGEFDTKKSKIKVFQANQHVGSQTVESVSYRLDDLKSGSVKIFRVASA